MAYIILLLLFNNRFHKNVRILIRPYNASEHIINHNNILNAIYIIYANVKNLITCIDTSLLVPGCPGIPIYRFRFETTATLSFYVLY